MNKWWVWLLLSIGVWLLYTVTANLFGNTVLALVPILLWSPLVYRTNEKYWPLFLAGALIDFYTYSSWPLCTLASLFVLITYKPIKSWIRRIGASWAFIIGGIVLALSWLVFFECFRYLALGVNVMLNNQMYIYVYWLFQIVILNLFWLKLMGQK